MVNSRLLIRLSSLGDVILASSALEALASTDRVDWATTFGYSELIQTHPKVRQIFVFDRQTGLRGWVEFCRQAWSRHYYEILDLHGNLRTLIMRVLFLYWGFLQPDFRPQWKTISKQRFRLWGYFIFKKFWFKAFRPSPWVQRYTRLANGTGEERPNLKHLLQGGLLPSELLIELKKQKLPLLCIMPSTKWDGKKWSVKNYVQVLVNRQYFPVVLGSHTDAESRELCKALATAGIPYFSGVGKWNLTQTASVLAFSKGYFGSDTGLAHLAEAVGVPAHIVFGPTTPEMGFAPWRSDSLAIGKSLLCRPCSKDGRVCFRILNRYSCLKDLSAQTVLEQLDSNNKLRGLEQEQNDV